MTPAAPPLMPNDVKGRVLIIAGSDPSGGAGVQADVKTVTALNAYAMTAITALTVQNTRGVSRVEPIDVDLVLAQIDACLEDIGADAVKIGLLPSVDVAEGVADRMADLADETPIVLDPVLIATSGDALTGEGVAGSILGRLAPIARLVTPNADELCALTGQDTLQSTDELESAARDLLRSGVGAVLAKGGHVSASGDVIVDVLVEAGRTLRLSHARIDAGPTHGTGCTLASAVAAGLAKGFMLDAAVERAIAYVARAIETAPRLGRGARPLNHACLFEAQVSTTES